MKVFRTTPLDTQIFRTTPLDTQTYGLRVDVRVWCLTPPSIFQWISWWSVLLVVETRVPGENHRPAISQWQILSHSNVSSGIRTHNFSGDRYLLDR